MMLYILITIN